MPGVIDIIISSADKSSGSLGSMDTPGEEHGTEIQDTTQLPGSVPGQEEFNIEGEYWMLWND